jgi:FkbM family methyltransferase
VICERLASESIRRRRLAKLQGTPGARLQTGHIDSLELLEIAREAGIGVVYDIGCNVGTWSLLAKSVLPSCQIHAFEPLLHHQMEFRKVFADMADVVLHTLALGPENMSGSVRVTDFTDASSILPLTKEGATRFGTKETAQCETRVCRLDDYRLEANLPPPDLLKLDIQGYELQALLGAKECLNSARAVIAEVSFGEFYKGQCLFHELAHYLAEFGMLPQAFGLNTPTGRRIDQTDVLFMRLPSDRRATR